MNVLLVHLPVRKRAEPNNIPLGVLYTAAALKRAGIKYQVLDLNEKRWSDFLIAAFIGSGKFTHIGISAMVTQYREVERLVGIAGRSAPGVPVVVGGPVSVLGDDLVKWMPVAVWDGESEEDLNAEVLGLIGTGEQVGTSPIDVNKAPLPDWNSVNMGMYSRNPVGAPNRNKWGNGHRTKDTPLSMNMLWSRGCPRKCSFCAHNFSSSKYRKRSPESIIQEMEILWQQYDIKYFHTSDDSSMTDKAWLAEVCNLIAKHEFLKDCTWGCAGRADECTVDTLTMMKQAGCVLVGMGVESGSQKMLDVYNKGASVDDNVNAINACKAVFGSADYSLMVGGPGEDNDTIAETVEMCQVTKTRPEVVFMVTPYPGTDLYDMAIADGLIVDERVYVRSLGEQGEQISCNVSGQSNEWLWDAKARIVRETFRGGSLL